MVEELKELNINQVVACIEEATGENVIIKEVRVNGERIVVGTGGELTLFCEVIK